MSSAIDGSPLSGAYIAMSIATSPNDLTNLAKNWACQWSGGSPNQFTLNRNWDGPSTDGSHIYHPSIFNLSGYGQQPFMLGIKSYGENLLATQAVPALSSYVSPYRAITTNSTSWIWTTGMDHQLFATNYGRIFQQCEPTTTAPGGTNFFWRSAGCNYGLNPTGGALAGAREQNAETAAAHAIYYAANPTTPNQTLGDDFYMGVWGFCPWTQAGFPCDANSAASWASSSKLERHVDP